MARNVNERELKAQIEKLQKQLQKVEGAKQVAVRKVVALMNKLGVTVADLREADASPDTAVQGRKRKAMAPRRQKSPARYRNVDGSEWTGRGPIEKYGYMYGQYGGERV